VKEVKVASEPAALLKVLGNPTYRFKRIGLEADIRQVHRLVRFVHSRSVCHSRRTELIKCPNCVQQPER
jgi:hypothetical protein